MDEKKTEIKNIPVIEIKMMSDDEWNRLAYKNWIERTSKAVICNG